MKKIDTSLNDAFIVEVDKYKDERGFFLESFNSQTFCDHVFGMHHLFVQDNHSHSTANVLRGLHYQMINPQGKLVRCMVGRVLDVIVDLRKSSTTFGQHIKVELNSPEKMLWVPPGFAHGFYVMSPTCEVSYKTDQYYYKPGDRTLLWNDPDLGIEWPTQTPILSEKDKVGKTFKECEKYD